MDHNFKVNVIYKDFMVRSHSKIISRPRLNYCNRFVENWSYENYEHIKRNDSGFICPDQFIKLLPVYARRPC